MENKASSKSSSVKSNIWKIYLFRIFGSAVFVMPIWVLYLQDKGISLTQVMIMHAVYTLTMLFLTIPFGALADLKGRKYVLIISEIAVIIGYLMYIFSNSFWGFLIGEILFGISTASFFGVLEAFIYDTLKQVNQISKYNKVQGRVYAINDFMMGSCGLIGAFIAAAISKWFTFLISVVPLMIALFLCFGLKEPKHSKSIYGKDYISHIKETLKFTWNHTQVKWIILFSAIVGTFMFTTFLMNSVYFEKSGVSLQYIGILYAIMFALSALGGSFYHLIEKRINKKFGEKIMPLIIAGAPALLLIGSYFVNPWLGIPFVILLWFTSVSLRSTFISDFINRHISSHHRATVMAINIMFGNLITAILFPIFGMIADMSSVTTVYLVMGIALAIYLPFVAIGTYSIQKK